MMIECLWSSTSLSSACSSSSLVAFRACGSPLGAPADCFPSNSSCFATPRASVARPAFVLPGWAPCAGLDRLSTSDFRSSLAAPACLLRSCFAAPSFSASF
eukprot:11899663-Heterocapsa_arctica.AAC.1